jgi:MFS transporter, UMF1 family
VVGIFTIIPLRLVKHRAPLTPRASRVGHLAAALHQLRETVRVVRRYPQTLRFLIAYVLYADGIAAVLALSSQFGSEELGLAQDTLIQAILLVQVVGAVGAVLFAAVAERIGTKRAIMFALLLWLGVIVYAYGFIAPHRPAQFFALAAVIALVLGGTMALTRSLFSQMIPRGQEAEFFGLYEVVDNGTSWLAPFLFAVALQFTGSYRIAIVSLIVFFLAGLIVLISVNVQHAIRDVGNVLPGNL